MSTRQERILQRARELAKEPTSDQVVAWATNVLTLVELLHKRENADNLRALIDTTLREGRMTPLKHVVHGVAQGLLSDLESGFIPDFEGRIRSEVEGDLLAQARRLLEDEGLKDPAAMIIGAVLEDALRQLCRKHGVPEGDKIEAMNEPLRKQGVYGLPQKQQVTAWAAIRNKADHARFGEYTEAEVRLMHQGVSGFIATYLGGHE